MALPSTRHAPNAGDLCSALAKGLGRLRVADGPLGLAEGHWGADDAVEGYQGHTGRATATGRTTVD
jgi:hypothetical protein